MSEGERFKVAILARGLEADRREALDQPGARLEPSRAAGPPAPESGRCQQRHVRHQEISIDVMPYGLAARHCRRLRGDGTLLNPACSLDVCEDQDDDTGCEQTASSSCPHPVSLPATRSDPIRPVSCSSPGWSSPT